ncbi:MAG: NCS2 family permease [Thermoanaerobaculia bacterium]|jgi:AGZA family xanthine/uracil permease-like MFS transporter
MRWFVRGDIDGFFGLALDNLVQLLLIDALCRFVLGFPPELVYGRVLPGAAISILVGNLAYAYQARRLAERTGRSDVCALPYGINTVSLFAHVFLVMLPAKALAIQAGAADPGRIAWQAGLLATLCSGVIEIAGALVADRVRKATPRAALLSTLAGIALAFISGGFLFRTFAHPVVGLTTFGVVILTYFGRVRFRGRIPGGMVAVGLGTILSWVIGIAPVGVRPTPPVLHLPVPVIGDLVAAIGGGHLIAYLSVIVAMGIFNVVGSLQNIESAEAAGDAYQTRPSLLINGIGSIAAALFGSAFPTTIYIGHPGWKAMGARIGYSVLNGAFITVICLTGTLAWIAWAIPIDAGMAIVLWIGIVIGAQAFQATPRAHAPAVVIGMLPGLGAWGALLAKNGLRAAGLGTPDHPFGPAIVGEFLKSDTWIHGAFSLEQGFLFTSMLLSAAVVGVIERRWRVAAAWCAVAALLSATGLMHSYQWTMADTAIRLAPAWPFVIGYGAMAILFFTAQWTTEEGAEH